MMTILFTSTLVGLASSHWIMIWVALEINTLAMCYLISNDSSKIKDNQSSTMNYYFIQVMSSVVLLISMTSENSMISEIIMTMALIMKMGGWPSHLWYLKLISSMKMTMKSFMLVMTWQKILPVCLMLSLNPSKMTLSVLMILAVASAVSPLAKLSGKVSFKSMMALSSLNNNGWMMVSAMTSMLVFSTMLAIYSVTLMITLKFFSKMNKKSDKMMNSPWVTMLTAGNLSGLPPMSMFWVKILVVQKALESNMPSEMLGVLIIMACVMLYYYLWMTLPEIPKSPKKHQNVIKENNNTKVMVSMSVMSMMSAMLILILGLTWKGSILMG